MSISSPPNYGTPDWQRGFYSAQKLLASVAANVGNVTVNVPPNAESLVINVNGNLTVGKAIVQVHGLGSGIFYNAVLLPGAANTFSSWFTDVSEAIDTQVKVTILPTPTDPWFVYADAGVHLTADISKLMTLQSVQYVAPSAPSNIASDRPPVELQIAGGVVATGATFLAAPGATNRIRLFGLNIADNGATSISYIIETGNGQLILACAAPGAATLAIPVTGFPMVANTGLQTTSTSGARTLAVVAYYTIEAV